MTQSEQQRCGWCGAAFEANPGPGRPRRYCKRSHRQRHSEATTWAVQRGTGADELLVERSKVENLHDLMYILEAACDDVVADVESARGEADLRRAVADLVAAARPLRDSYLEPKADLLG